MPVITGLYTILVPIVAFAIFGSSRHLVVGADSATAVMMSTGLLSLGLVAASPSYVAMAGLSALLCAGLLLVARLLRLGFIANFLSRSVLIGFLTGVGIQVALGQVGGIFGIAPQPGGTLERLVATVRLIPNETVLPTLGVSIVVFTLVYGLKRVNHRIPGALIAVIVTIAASSALNLAAHGVAVLGVIPSGLPQLGLPSGVLSTEDVVQLFPTALAMVVVILAQSAATSRAYALKYSDSFDENVDLVGLGLANGAAAITGAFVVNGSPTKTEMVDSAGGRTQVSQLTAALLVVPVLLFLTGPLARLPEAVLASVVFIIGLRLIDTKGMRDVLRVRPAEFAVAALTALTVIIVGVEQGILLAMGLSVVEHLYHSYRPYDSLLVEAPDGSYRAAPEATGGELEAGLIVYRFGASLYYANATRFMAEVLGLVKAADPAVRWFVVACGAIGDIDYSGAASLRQVQQELRAMGVTLVLADISDQLRQLLDRYGLAEQIGEANLYDTIREAASAYRRGPGAEGGQRPTSARLVRDE